MVSEQNLGGELAHNEFRKPKSTVYYKKTVIHLKPTGQQMRGRGLEDMCSWVGEVDRDLRLSGKGQTG